MSLRIGIIVDWARSARGSGWEALLRQLHDDGLVANTCQRWPVADQILQPPDSAGHFMARDLDVIVVNWDAANGDPEFGAHLTQRWLEHRQMHLLPWVREGGVLIVEGQANLSVPTQRAYDALVGEGEMPVCGPEDRLNPMRQVARMGGRCRRTSRMPDEKGFENVPEVLEPQRHPTFDDLFPAHVQQLLPAHLSYADWPHLLYRGWFGRRLRRRELPWVSLVETDRGHGHGIEHSTLQVARLGRGAIFLSTMFLATTGQVELIRALLGCVRDTDHLPVPRAMDERLRRGLEAVLPALVGLAVGHLTGAGNHVLSWVGAARPGAVGGGPLHDDDLTKEVAKLLFVPAGILLYDLARRLARRLRRGYRDAMGR